ncbi:MAG: hypothetical protein AB1700_00740 [Bacillota bacterium]
MRKVVHVLIIAVIFVLGLTPSVWANTWWENPDKHPTPSCFSGREYTRQHRVEFRYDEGAGPQGPLFTGWCSVFDLPPKYDQGYTAVGTNDEAWSKAYGWLPCLGVPNVDGYFIVSPNHWGTQGAVPSSAGFVPNPMAPSPNNSEQMWVSVTRVKNSSGLTLGFDTIDNPKCFENGPTGQGFEAGGYDSYNTGWHWYPLQSDLSKAPVSVTKKYASTMWGSQKTTWAKLCYSYLYNLTCLNVEKVGQGRSRDTFRAHFINTTPFLAKDVTLRAYIVQDGKYTLAAQTSTEIGPLPLGMVSPQGTPRYGSGVSAGSTSNAVTWTFEAPVSAGNYKLIVSANLAFAESGTKLPAPLTTRTAYGSWGATLSPLTGTKYEVKPLLTTHGSNPYDDNWAELGLAGGGPSQPPGEVEADDLAVTDIKVLDDNKNPVGTTLEEGKTYYVRATFQSGFDVGGWATVRLYRYDPDQKRMYDCGSEYAYFNPEGTVVKDFGGFGWGAGSYTLIATVDYYNNGDDPSSGWVEEKFDGKYDEATYDNNRKDLSVGVGESPPYVPQPQYWSYNLYYPPLVTKTVPVYKTVYTVQWQDHWIQVPVYFEEVDGKIVVRLVPNSPPSAPGD